MPAPYHWGRAVASLDLIAGVLGCNSHVTQKGPRNKHELLSAEGSLMDHRGWTSVSV